jgi:hypothetical protein
MRKRGSRGCAAGLIHDVDFHDIKSVRIRVIRVLSSFRSSYEFVLSSLFVLPCFLMRNGCSGNISGAGDLYLKVNTIIINNLQ